MPWLDERDSAATSDNVWLVFPPLKNVGDKTEVRIRILSGDPERLDEPAGVWVHWFEGRPYNCPGGRQCPVCDARAAAKTTNPDSYRTDFPVRHKYYFNVLTTEDGKPVVRVYGFSKNVGDQLRSYAERYGPLTGYDITIRKTQVGRLPINVEYSLFYDGVRELTDAERAAAKEVHDLSQFTKPATYDVLRSVARGETPTPADSEQGRLIGQIRTLIPADVDISHFGVSSDTSTQKLETLLQSLRG